MKRSILALLVCVAACGPVTPPIVVPRPPDPPRSVQATIRGAQTPAADLLADDGLRVECRIVSLEAFAHRAVCVLDPRTPAPFGGHLIITAPDRLAQTIDFLLTGEPNQALADVVLRPSFVPLPRLVPVGRVLRRVDGVYWTAIEASDFALYQRFLDNEDIGPVLTQRRHPWPDQPDREGFTLLRVWTAFDVCATGAGCQQIGRLVPREHPDFYARIPEFLNLCASHGLYVELTAFTGPYESLFANDDEKVQHWDRLIAAVRGNSGLAYLELVNEADHPANKDIPFDRLRRPDGVLASHGSGTQDAQPPQPYWDVITYRPAAGETHRKAGHNAGELSGFGAPPAISNETQRFPDNDNDPTHAYDMAAGCVLLSMGCDFHSIRGKNSTRWDGDELRDAQAFAAGGHSVPLNPCQDGRYENLGDVPSFLRVYRTGGVDACTVRIRP